MEHISFDALHVGLMDRNTLDTIGYAYDLLFPDKVMDNFSCKKVNTTTSILFCVVQLSFLYLFTSLMYECCC